MLKERCRYTTSNRALSASPAPWLQGRIPRPEACAPHTQALIHSRCSSTSFPGLSINNVRLVTTYLREGVINSVFGSIASQDIRDSTGFQSKLRINQAFPSRISGVYQETMSQFQAHGFGDFIRVIVGSLSVRAHYPLQILSVKIGPRRCLGI